MKRRITVPLVLAISFSLVSCFWMAGTGTGSLQLDFSGLQARQPGDVARVYLVADGLLFSTGGGVPFAAQVTVPDWPNGSAEISIDGLPVGPRYRAMVGVGQVTGDVFAVSSAGESAPFEVAQGSSTSIRVPMEQPYYFSGVYFSSELMGKYLKGVAGGSGTDAYTAEESQTYFVSVDTGTFPYTLSVNDSYDLALDPHVPQFGVSAHRVNGLSDDWGGVASDAFANTNKGIVPFYGIDGWGFDPTFSNGLGGDTNVLESASAYVVQDQVVFFRRANGVGGRFFPLSGGPDPWVNVDTPGVLDMVLGDYNAYFAAEDGAFALPPAFLRDLTPTLAEHRLPFSAPAPIRSLGFKPGAAAAAKLFMGTTDGVYEADLTESPTMSLGSATQILETDGERIEMIDISRYWPDSNQAFLSRYWLYIRDRYGYVYRYPFFAVVPGKATGMSWSSNGVLFISGTEGLSALYVGS